MANLGNNVLLLRRPPLPWTRPNPDARHEIDVIDRGNGVWELSCRCGAQVFTPWGLTQARRRAAYHLMCQGLPVPSELWPEDGMAP